MYMAGPASLRLSDGSIRQVDFTDPSFGPLVHAQGAVPVKPDGSPYSVTQAFGGDLWDSCPIQVAIEEAGNHSQNTWVISQIEVLKAAGIVPGCLVPGSPNFTAFHYDAGGGAPASGTGHRTTNTGATVVVNPAPAVLQTGIATPSVSPLPGGGMTYTPAEPEDPTPVQQAGILGDGGILPWLLAGGLLLTLLSGGGRRRKE